MGVTYTSTHTGGKIDNMITKSDETNIAYATCSTAEATTAKVATISGNTNWKLMNGSMIVVKFTYAVPANSTLNVNDTGAKSVFRNGAAITAGYIKAGEIALLTYDGTNYVLTAGQSPSVTGTTLTF